MLNRITDTTTGVTAHTQSPFKNKKYEPPARRIARKESVPRALEIFKAWRKNITTNMTETTAGVTAHTYLSFENRETEKPANTNAINTSK